MVDIVANSVDFVADTVNIVADKVDFVASVYGAKETRSTLSTFNKVDFRLSKRELSYRQQIARQLRTQYAEGIYRHKFYTVTLKPRLRVTQGHWKRNHWIDHKRLTISGVI